jgi:hypothetical protein
LIYDSMNLQLAGDQQFSDLGQLGVDSFELALLGLPLGCRIGNLSLGRRRHDLGWGPQ